MFGSQILIAAQIVLQTVAKRRTAPSALYDDGQRAGDIGGGGGAATISASAEILLRRLQDARSRRTVNGERS